MELQGGLLSPVLVVHLVVVLVAIALAILVYLLARRSLGELLSRTVAVPGGVVFFTRTFLLLLIFGVVGPAVTGNPDVKPGQHFMEYVWLSLQGVTHSRGLGGIRVVRTRCYPAGSQAAI